MCSLHEDCSSRALCSVVSAFSRPLLLHGRLMLSCRPSDCDALHGGFHGCPTGPISPAMDRAWAS